MTRVVRVAVNNNFNCSKREFDQLDKIAAEHPEDIFFVNANIKTPNLLKINDHPYKVVITLNPDLIVDPKHLAKLYKIDSGLIAFTRIKYLPEHPEINDLIREVSLTYPVVITLQRFNGKKSIEQYVPNYRKYYVFNHTRFRLTEDSLKEVLALVGSNVFICDQAGLGCGGCGLCSKLTTGEDYPIHSLNLSSSGECPYSCVDCYAKTMQHFLRSINRPTIHYDWIHMNSKQSGKTAHIKSSMKK